MFFSIRYKQVVFPFFSSVILLLAFLVLPGFSSFSTNPPDQDWVDHIAKGESKKLSSYLSQVVSLELLSQSGSYNKNQAVMVLADFFSLYPAEKVVLRQTGTTGSTNMYFIGDYECRNVVYRLYVQMNNLSGEYLIYSMSIKKK